MTNLTRLKELAGLIAESSNISDIRVQITNRLESRPVWKEGVTLWNSMLHKADTDNTYNKQLSKYLDSDNNGEYSTVYLRDVLAAPFSDMFDTDHLTFFNAWVAIDTAHYNEINKPAFDDKELAGLSESTAQVPSIYNVIIYMMDEGTLQPRQVADSALTYMNKDDVADMALYELGINKDDVADITRRILGNDDDDNDDDDNDDDDNDWNNPASSHHY